MNTTAVLNARQKNTSRVLWASNLLNEPLFTLYGFLGFILYKDLGASAWVIALMTTLKPVVTILSFYWAAGKKRLKSNAMWAGVFMRVPFLLCPWVDDVWFVVAAAVNYMFWYRAGVPAWLEILKRNIKRGRRERSFSLSSGLAYAEGVVLALGMGGLLDREPGLWKFLFFGAAIVGLFSVVLLSRIDVEEEVEEKEVISWKERVVRPWRDSLRLMRERPDFSLFQWGFMLCGFGVMLIQPALPLLAVDALGISYIEMAAAISVAKGLGFSFSSPLWGRMFERFSITQITSGVFLSFGLFPLLLALSPFGLGWLYAAYFWYGVAQGGCHLVWNMSGPLFAGKEDSSRYTGVNVVLAGLRGAVAPGLGSWLSMLWGPIQVLCIGGVLCFYSGFWLFRRKAVQTF
ncbi:MAG: MFS transporter [Verrucomicrobiota bacterium]|nr:MFS transporter [Verrucomicrobiota bacterium]